MRIRTVSGLQVRSERDPRMAETVLRLMSSALDNHTAPRLPIVGKHPSVLNGRRPEPLSNDFSFDNVGGLRRRLGADSHFHVRLATSQSEWPGVLRAVTPVVCLPI